MKNILLIHAGENSWRDSERERCSEQSTRLGRQPAASGQRLATNPLQSVATATSVRVRDGKRHIADSPLAETREQLGGYFLIDARDLDEAICVGERITGAQGDRRNRADAGDPGPAGRAAGRVEPPAGGITIQASTTTQDEEETALCASC